MSGACEDTEEYDDDDCNDHQQGDNNDFMEGQKEQGISNGDSTIQRRQLNFHVFGTYVVRIVAILGALFEESHFVGF